ncbi:PSD1 and planctomycete cytochrome C domain-containing protein [Catenovulum sp. 2E275]|uniref:PSD1 and planctomycete cytochrome C domain-containing protein n=1 Tax=Catenovulum sp. 2E275 TaxID=2980497 RepID=UPI0021D2DC42|nr:PSD1 and planctomycete cytochrome C domain-containing protein [Catenovulum sp. 2E275]MCU4676561.1 PSD1 and planctomycete cytochrome C domain-containing protein [Catenovulum sp. 2E275]
MVKLFNSTWFIKNRLLLVFSAIALTACNQADTNRSDTPVISFNESIRPILNKNCVGCHGGVTKQGGISYIYRNEALARGNSGRLNIVPGDAKASEFIQRIKSKDLTRRMPYKRPALSDNEIQLLEDWINQGAQWEEHWAFIPPKIITPPQTDNQNWINNPIDQFVLNKMTEQGLTPNPVASDSQWLRRASLDLTGLPPTEQQINQFVTSTDPNKFEATVDRLLSTKNYGERWASVWLDLARYSDSRGFERDKHRDSWPYRDWLIRAFNQNMPYDQFVIKQLAGDLLPEPELDDVVATTFNRLTPANDEAGTDDEEYRTYAVMDRNATTWIALNGITMNCVQCHAHPYDPITHTEYFNSLAFFNTSEDADRRDDSPNLKFAYDQNKRQALFNVQQAYEHTRTKLFAELTSWQNNSQWQPVNLAKAQINKPLAQLAIAEYDWRSLNPELQNQLQNCSKNNKKLAKSCKQLTDKHNNIFNAYRLAKTAEKSAIQADLPDSVTPLNITNGELAEPKLAIPALGVYQLEAEPANGKQTISAIKFNVAPLDPAKAIHTPQDGFTVEKVDIKIIRHNGEQQPVAIQQFIPASVYGFNQMLDLYSRRSNHQKTSAQTHYDSGWYTGLSAHLLHTQVSSYALLTKPIELNRGDKLAFSLYQLQKDHSRGEKPYYLRQLQLTVSDSTAPQKPLALLAQAKAQNLTINQTAAASLPVMQEQIAQERRSTRIFTRGNFTDKEANDILPLTPAVFSSQLNPKTERANRLDLAKWFFDDDQPLTSRVAVNRIWAQFFGQGIVKTLGDFGSIGAQPSHPELLDWLAVYFQKDLNWDIKQLAKTIVLSSTYRQSAIATADKKSQDPNNTYLARGPRQRLSAEMIRDQALFAAGLLSDKQFGESVMPPQPDGVWQTVYNQQKWVEATGENRYRRAIYTYNKRTSPYPSFITFDDTGHIISAPQRFTTNTPLQALVTLNDVVYHEAAQALADILLKTKQQQHLNAAINQGFLRLASRPATDKEINVLTQSYQQAIKLHQDKTQPELAAMTDLAATIMNLDTSLNR